MDYAIGDIQGCFDTLQKLLKKINFNIDSDRLFFWVMWSTVEINP
tara:strand:- start:6 stop:140 length:135 start_codon:yes stop_codon:yes gene_type:complete